MNFFFETRTLTGVYLTWSSCYWNVLVLANSIMFLIKTITKVTNVTGYHQPADLSTNRRVHAPYL